MHNVSLLHALYRTVHVESLLVLFCRPMTALLPLPLRHALTLQEAEYLSLPTR